VQNLYVSERLVNRVAAALKELTGEMATEVLPVLRSISLQGLQVSGPVQDALTSFFFFFFLSFNVLIRKLSTDMLY
jgi:hypothetical protein